MSLPRVGVLHEPFGAASLHDIRRASKGLCRPVIILAERVAAEYPALVRAAAAAFEVVVANGESYVSVLLDLRLDGLTTFHDGLLESLASGVAMLGLPGMGAAESWDKLVARQRLRQAGLTRARAAAVDSAADLRAGVDDLGMPCVLKPRRGMGGIGVAFLNTDGDVSHQVATRTRWRGLMLETTLVSGHHPHGGGCLADFVSVETVMSATDHCHVAVFDKRSVKVVKHAGVDGADLVTVTGDIIPSRLPADMTAELLTYTSRCLEALGVRQRVTHAEIKLTPDGPDVIEVNGRMGGHLNRLLRLVDGPDLARAALMTAMGQRVDQKPWQARGYAAGLFPSFPFRTGTVRSEVSISEVRALPGVRGVDEVAGHGQPVESTGGRMVNLTLSAASARELDGVIANALAEINRLFAGDLMEQSI